MKKISPSSHTQRSIYNLTDTTQYGKIASVETADHKNSYVSTKNYT